MSSGPAASPSPPADNPRPRGRSAMTRNLWRRFIGTSVSTAAGYAIGGAVQPVLEPITQSLANELWSRHPSRPLGAPAAARAQLLGIWTPEVAEAEALRSGVNPERLAALVASMGDAPAPDTLLELRRRRAITDDQLEQGLSRQGVLPAWRQPLRALVRYIAPPSDAIRFAVREVYNPPAREQLNLDAEFPDAFADAVAELGIDRETAGNYWAAHWQLPSYEQLSDMLFRGELTQQQYRDSLKALDYAPTWRGKLEAIARRIPTMTDFTRMVVREVFNPTARQSLNLDAEYPAAFTAKAALHGMSEDDARDLWAAHWDLPSPTQAYRMLWRKLITPGELDDLLKALDYAPTWRGKLRDIAYLVPGRVDLRRMLAAGVLNRDQVKLGYEALGYEASVAETLTRFAEFLAAGGEVVKRETVAELRDEREGGYITDAEFRQGLELLGYQGAPLEAMLNLASARRSKRWREKAVDAIGKAFIQGEQTEAGARALLERAGVTGDAAEHLFQWWRIIDDATEKRLTAAQVRAAYRKNVLTRDQAVQALEGLDYRTTDANAFLDS